MATILVVEDREDTRTMLKTSLETRDHTVYLAENGEQAVAKAKEHATELDLVLLDFYLPDFSGETVLQKLQSNPETEHLPVVFLTAADVKEPEEALLEMQGASDVLLKPVKIDTLLEKINSVLGE